MTEFLPIDQEQRDYLRESIRTRLDYKDMPIEDDVLDVIVDVTARWCWHAMMTNAFWPLKADLAEAQERIRDLLARNTEMRAERAAALKRATTLEQANNRQFKQIKLLTGRTGEVGLGDLFEMLVERVRDEVSR